MQRKPKNSAIMEYKPRKTLDIWLSDRAYYRKHIALDETCLFRAVSDQVYNTQVYHEDIRTRCITYAVEHKDEFKDCVSDWAGYAYKLRNHLICCGDTEIKILSKLYKRDVIIFNEYDLSVNNVTKNNYKEKFLLCKMKGGHFDSVIKKKKIETEGFCQSLVYKILYEKVFHIENVDGIVDSMLNDSKTFNKDTSKFDTFDLLVPKKESKTDQSNFGESLALNDISENGDVFPPFPYKAAKALDPNQYRNVAYDAWHQDRKDARIKDWYMGGDDFKVGTKCVLETDGKSLNCYIQELNYGSADVCMVYVVDTAERRVVHLQDLRPVPDAKPWPLPNYALRNARRVRFSHTEQQIELKHDRKRKYQNKRRCYSDGAVPWLDRSSVSDNWDMQSVASLEGCPFIASVCSQFTDTVKLDFDDSGYINNNTDVCNNCEPFADRTSNQMVHYENFNQYSMQSFVPVVQGGMPVQNVPLIVPQKSITPNGADLPFHGVECVRQNYWQMWLPPLPGPTPVPLMTPAATGAPYSPAPQMCVAAQLNMIQHDNDTKYTFCSQFIKDNQVCKNYCYAESVNVNNNNNNCASNYNYNGVPSPEAPLNYVPEVPYTCQPPSVHMPPPALPLDVNAHRALYPDMYQPYMSPMYLPLVPTMPYYPPGPHPFVPYPVPPPGAIPMVENHSSSSM